MKEEVDPPPPPPLPPPGNLFFGLQSPTTTSHSLSQPEFYPNPFFQPNQNPFLHHPLSFSNSSSQNALITGSSTPPLGSGLSLGLNYNYSGRENPVDLELGLGLGFDNAMETQQHEGEEEEDDDDDNQREVESRRREEIRVFDYDFDNESVVNDDLGFFHHHHHNYGGDEVVESSIHFDTNVFDAFDDHDFPIEGFIFGSGEAIRDMDWEGFLNRAVEGMEYNVEVYEAIIDQMDDQLAEFKGSPPASEGFISRLSSVKLEKKESEVVCPICMDDDDDDDVVVLKELPCSHCFHKSCIVRWLRIRNTCPVCRCEFPTDDAEYEFRKRIREMEQQGVNVDLNRDLQEGGYGFHVFL